MSSSHVCRWFRNVAGLFCRVGLDRGEEVRVHRFRCFEGVLGNHCDSGLGFVYLGVLGEKVEVKVER